MPRRSGANPQSAERGVRPGASGGCCYRRLDFAYDIKLLLDALKVDKADIVGLRDGLPGRKVKIVEGL